MELETKLPVPDREARKTIEDEDSKDDDAFQKFHDDVTADLNNLEKEKATHEEVEAVKDAWNKKIEHVALGTDLETVKQAVMQILKEKGMI